jgi:low temperature requirement protein LtrA
MASPSGRVHPTEESHQVTQFELFFDLVFVFAFTQVTQLMADDPTAQGALRGVVLLALLWWAWCSYAWLGNEARADRGLVAATITVAMGAMFLVALSIPESFADLPGGWNAPFVLAACYAVVRLAHLACYYIAAADNPALRRQLLLTALPVVPATGLLVLGAVIGPPWQTLLWALALLVDYVGIAAVGVSGWRLRSPGHFAERHGLIVIIAIGESLVALGVGVAQEPISGPVAAGAVLGLLTACCLWWLYFRRVAVLAEHALAECDGPDRGRLGRDTYSYLHFPVVASVIFIALGLKKVLEYVSDTEAHDLADPLTGMPIVALFGGLAVYLFGLTAVRRRVAGPGGAPRIVAGVVLVALIPVAWVIPALAALALATAVVVALVGHEAARTPEPAH